MNKLKRFLLSAILALTAGAALGQSIHLRKIATLPDIVKETSGILVSGNGIWTHNDSGNGAILYNVDSTGALIRSLNIENAVNRDWEDITRDERGYCYIGDFGNNNNTRKNLTIYQIFNPDSIPGSSAFAETISFSYPDQKEFPPSNDQKNFDAEAMICLDTNLYIFTKNRTSPFTGYTYLYKIPARPGTYEATLLDSFRTGSGMKELFWVSSAALSPDHSRLVLLCSDKIFVFTSFKGDGFFKGNVKRIELNSISQKEAIVFKNNDEFYITDEYYKLLGGNNLYSGSLKGLIKEKDTSTIRSCKLIKYQSDSGKVIISLNKNQSKAEVRVVNDKGEDVKSFILTKKYPKIGLDLSKGSYRLIVKGGKTTETVDVIID